MPQQSEISKSNTSVINVKGLTIVTLHDTPVVVFDDKTITLDTGGFFTALTKTRMNQTSNQFDLGFRIYTKDRIWLVDFKGKTLNFISHIVELVR